VHEYIQTFTGSQGGDAEDAGMENAAQEKTGRNGTNSSNWKTQPWETRDWKMREAFNVQNELSRTRQPSQVCCVARSVTPVAE